MPTVVTIRNASFEDGQGVRSVPPSQWLNLGRDPDAFSDAGTPDHPNVDASDGTGYLGLFSRNSDGYAETVGQNLTDPLIAGTTYTFTFDARAETNYNLDTGGSDLLHIDDQNGNNLATVAISNDSADGMTTYSVTFTPTQNVTQLRLANKTRDGGGNVGYILIDNVSMTVCFAAGTHIRTINGTTPVEELRAGDLIATLDHGHVPVRWIGKDPCSRLDLINNPKLRPVRIRKGALGTGVPSRDLRVSRQHRIMVTDPRSKDGKEVFLPAIRLTVLKGIGIDKKIKFVDYYHILLDRHEVILAEDCAAESLHLGEEALKTLPEQSLLEISRLFPDPGRPGRPMAREVPEPKAQRAIAAALGEQRPQRHRVAKGDIAG